MCAGSSPLHAIAAPHAPLLFLWKIESPQLTALIANSESLSHDFVVLVEGLPSLSPFIILSKLNTVTAYFFTYCPIGLSIAIAGNNSIIHNAWRARHARPGDRSPPLSRMLPRLELSLLPFRFRQHHQLQSSSLSLAPMGTTYVYKNEDTHVRERGEFVYNGLQGNSIGSLMMKEKTGQGSGF